MTDPHLARNLRTLCTCTTSMSDAFRSMGINRQQVTKFLAGASRPSPHDMRRIGDHFDVEEGQSLVPHGRCAEMIGLRPRARRVIRAPAPAAPRIDRMFNASADSPKPCCGDHFHDDHTPGRPGMSCGCGPPAGPNRRC